MVDPPGENCLSSFPSMSNQEAFEYHLMSRVLLAARAMTGNQTWLQLEDQNAVRHLGAMLLNTWYLCSPYLDELKSISVR
jgi:hypothetical protein